MRDAACLRVSQPQSSNVLDLEFHVEDANSSSDKNNNQDLAEALGDHLAENLSPGQEIKDLGPLIQEDSLSEVDWRGYLAECPVKGCELAFASESLVQEHLILAHNQMMPPDYQGLLGSGHLGHQGHDDTGHHDGVYPCPLCDSTFDSKDLLEEHIDSHQQDRGILECDFCGKEFLSRLELTKHMALHAQESQGDPQCQLCGKFFATREEAIVHLKVHSNAASPGGRIMKQRKFKCERCDRSFFTRKDVKRHMVVHTGQRNFVCQYCPQKFGRKDHLVRHTKKTHTNGTGGSSNNNGNNNNNNNNPNAPNNNTISMGVVSSGQGALQAPIVQNGSSGQVHVPSPPVPLSDPGVSSTTGLLLPEPRPPQSPLLGPSIVQATSNQQQQQLLHQQRQLSLPHSSGPPGTPSTPVLKNDGQLTFTYSDLSPAQLTPSNGAPFHLDEVVAVPQSPQLLTPLIASTSSPSNTHQQVLVNSASSVTVLQAPIGGLGTGTGLNVSVLQSGKDPLVSQPSWPPTSSAPPTAYLSPSFGSYFVDDENRNAVPLTLKGGDPLPSMATLTSLPAASTGVVTTNGGLPHMTADFHPSSTSSSSYFTLMPIISQAPQVGIGIGGYYSLAGGGGQGGLSPLSPTSPQTTTPLTPPLADALGSPLPHFSQAFQ